MYFTCTIYDIVLPNEYLSSIYLNKSKSYVGDMQAKVKQRKIILENFAALIVLFSPEQREITQIIQQPTKC